MSAEPTPQPRIARIWRGRVARARADEYAEYLYEHGIKPLEEKALGVQLFREDRATESEFVTVSYWESVEAWHSIDAAWLDEQERRFAEAVGADAYRLVAAPHEERQFHKVSEYR